MPLPAKDVRAALLKKGFKQRNTKDEMYNFYVAGKKTVVWTKISHGEKEIHDGLLGTMAKRQMRIPRKELDRFVECALSEADYTKLLRDGKHIA